MKNKEELAVEYIEKYKRLESYIFDRLREYPEKLEIADVLTGVSSVFLKVLLISDVNALQVKDIFQGLLEAYCASLLDGVEEEDDE